jgi:signal transduction histidine kinase
MKNMDWPRVFSLLAHELRSPAAVIGGYARMLSEGRLAEDDRQQAYVQIERAARRVTVIGQQASDLGHWLTPAPDGASLIALPALVAQSVTLAAAPDRVVTDESIEKSALSIPALDRAALTQAVTAAIDAVSREVTDDDVRVAARVNADQHACDATARR